MTDKTQQVIDALEKHSKLIKGAIEYRDQRAEKRFGGESKACQVVKAFTKNNAAELGLDLGKRPCVDWKKVTEHFRQHA